MKQLPVQFKKSSYILSAILFVIIAMVPFYAFLSTWISSYTGGLLLLRAWKELLLIPAFGFSIFILIKDRTFRTLLFKENITKIILVFVVWQLLTAALGSRDPDAVTLGLVIQLRLFAIYLLARIVAYYRPPGNDFIQKLALLPFVGVVVFGILQLFVLPYDFLKSFGYIQDVTIPPFFTIDMQLDRLRIASTLRGPNPLGVYLILPTIGLIAYLYKSTKLFFVKKLSSIQSRYALLATTLLLAGLVVLYGSHSRGSWIALVVAILVWLFLTASKRLKVIALTVVFIFSLGVGAAIHTYRETAFVKNVIFHDSQESGSPMSSNEGHLLAITEAVSDIQNDPLIGCGPGCAGPASVHSEDGMKLAENYFLQTAQESGLIGLMLLMSIFILVAFKLYSMRYDPYSAILLATFIGINVASLFAHAWADDTIAYIWWGLAGVVIGLHNRQDSEIATAKRLRTSAKVTSGLTN